MEALSVGTVGREQRGDRDSDGDEKACASNRDQGHCLDLRAVRLLPQKKGQMPVEATGSPGAAGRALTPGGCVTALSLGACPVTR